MTVMLLGVLMQGVTLTGVQRSLLLLPLCLSVAVVYKTTRCDHLREVPMSAALLWVTIVAGMYAVGVGLFVAFKLLV